MTTEQKVKEIDELRRSGASIEEASAKVGIHRSAYYAHKSKKKRGKGLRRNRSEMLEQFRKVDELISGGTPTAEAVKEVGVVRSGYSRYLKSREQAPRKSKSQLVTLTIPQSAAQSPLVILMGEARDVTQALEKLAQIQGARA